MNGIDYDLLRLGAWALAGLSLFGFALTAGFDLGIATLLPVLGRSDAERGRLIGTIEGHWEGNQTWFVVAGGLLFALWPPVYAVLLSGLTPLLLVALFGLMLRPAGFGFRHQIDDPRWRRLWDGVLCAGGVLPALAFGALLARLFAGLPFRHEGDALQPVFEAAPAHAAAWLPFTVVCAVLVLALFAQHGAARLLFSVRGVLRWRARRMLGWSAIAVLALSVAAVVLLATLPGLHAAGSDWQPPLAATQLSFVNGAWLDRYAAHPLLLTLPALALAGTLVAGLAAWRDRALTAFLGSTVALAGTLASAGVALFPFVLPSSLDPAASLSLWNAAASPLTLMWLYAAAAVLLPVVILYTAWAYAKLGEPGTGPEPGRGEARTPQEH